MATRIKTVEFAFQSRNTSLATATRWDFAAITLYLPETTSRTFRSVRIQVACRDTATSATSLTLPLVGIKLGAVAFSDTTLGNPPSNSGESGQYVFERDVTAYFTTNFGGAATQTCQIGVQFTGPSTINHLAKLIITYEYDDTDATFVKTARIPLDSNLGALTATLAEIGTNQIPNLDTFLPEGSKVYRNIWFELIYNESTVGAVNDAQLGMQVDAAAEHLTGLHESGLGSSCFGWYIWDQGGSPAWATNAVHAFKLRSSNITTASTFNHVGIVLCVTYEYAASSSTVIQSLVLTYPLIYHPLGAVGDLSYMEIPIWVEEPATVTLLQSGLLLCYSQQTSNSVILGIGSGTARTYVDANLMFCGQSALTHRFDSGAAQGSGLSLARGKNLITIKIYISAGNASAPNSFDGLIYLNYSSAKHASGEGVHNHSVLYNVVNSQIGNIQSILLASAQYIFLPEANFFLNSLAWCSWFINNAFAPTNLLVSWEANAGELSTSDFHDSPFYCDFADTEIGAFFHAITIMPHHQLFDRWSNDPQTERMSLTTSRRVRYGVSNAGARSGFIWLTYHGITFVAAGTVTGSAAGTVNLYLHDAATGELLATGSRSGNGAYSLTWFDNTRNCFVDAREDATHIGRSDDAVLA